MCNILWKYEKIQIASIFSSSHILLEAIFRINKAQYFLVKFNVLTFCLFIGIFCSGIINKTLQVFKGTKTL